MAFGARRVYPNDLTPRVALGVDIPFSDPGVFTPNYQTKEAIKNNLVNYFLTNPGERPGNPTFGAGLRAYIFSQIDSQDLNYIKEDVQTKLLTFFPDVLIQNLEVVETVESNTIRIDITYSVRDTGINDALSLSFN